ncbi:hypothetical protein ITP53_15175 [Nonomuraea sp. K274]|uniref:ATP-grasp domain-containing protein n=1 Tax=Nonomuraea cypriaca TaxID=1187855 RepID=A0A931EWT9_9ACTN|nr:hypothetical protein [Nonomuraea cypriaca]MBF8187054.1 hypothetical protein [Nonomuraea cypriaca]
MNGDQKVAVVYDTGSAGPLEVIDAATGVCDVVFLLDHTRPGVREAAELWEEISPEEVLHITGLSDEDIADRLRRIGVAGIVTFSEYAVVLTAALAYLAGLPYHRPDVAHRLTNKASQRRRLAEAGMEAIRFRTVTAPEDATSALAEVGLPAVVKPTVGAASRNAFPVTVDEPWSDVAPRLRDESELIIEELLVGDPTVAGEEWGDYLSVDAITCAGRHHCVAVVGKFPLIPPFREGGMIFPATVSSGIHRDAIELAFAALTALGVERGVTQTEIKLTRQGPRLIEVNGRLGGYVGDIVRRAVGVNMVRLALLAALGADGVESVPTPRGVTYSYFLPTPHGRLRLTGLRGLPEVRAVAGVTSVTAHARPGTLLDSSTGTQVYLGVVRGHAPDHAAVTAAVAAMHDRIEAAYSPC